MSSTCSNKKLHWIYVVDIQVATFVVTEHCGVPYLTPSSQLWRRSWTVQQSGTPNEYCWKKQKTEEGIFKPGPSTRDSLRTSVVYFRKCPCISVSVDGSFIGQCVHMYVKSRTSGSLHWRSRRETLPGKNGRAVMLAGLVLWNRFVNNLHSTWLYFIKMKPRQEGQKPYCSIYSAKYRLILKVRALRTIT